MTTPANIRLKPAPHCPDRGGRMKLRRPKLKDAWEAFWGCASWPNCQGTRGVQPNGLPEGISMWGSSYDN